MHVRRPLLCLAAFVVVCLLLCCVVVVLPFAVCPASCIVMAHPSNLVSLCLSRHCRTEP